MGSFLLLPRFSMDLDSGLRAVWRMAAVERLVAVDGFCFFRADRSRLG